MSHLSAPQARSIYSPHGFSETLKTKTLDSQFTLIRQVHTRARVALTISPMISSVPALRKAFTRL